VSDLLADVSVIIPLAHREGSWRALVGDLAPISHDAEVLLVATEPNPGDLERLTSECGLCARLVWVESSPGRARQMNLGAAQATRRFAWFLHADSRLSPEALIALERSVGAHPEALHYFDLRFLKDAPALMPLNAAGVWFRSHVLGLPFGDQGLCLRRDLFESLGRFDEQAAYGEDHLLVWAARRAGVPLRCCGAAISTSARKYHQHGWARTTARHLWLTAKQGVPQWAARKRKNLREPS
jgi:hypothetical protein